MLHLQSVSLDHKLPLPERFPFSVPIIRSLTQLEFTTPVTFFVGENGSGKSTLLEAIAAGARMITVGSASAHQDRTLADVQRLAERLKLMWTKRTHKGFFMRSEDFFGYAKQMAQMREELAEDLRGIDEDYKDRSETARAYARMAHAGQLAALEKSYGEGLDAGSHGESFFKLFQARFVPGGLYILDEPEAPLSPTRQLAFITLLHQMLTLDAQFLIATHSPLLLAYPGATIYSCDGERLEQVEYEALEHVTLTRDFLQNPQAYLRRLTE